MVHALFKETALHFIGLLLTTEDLNVEVMVYVSEEDMVILVFLANKKQPS